MKVSNEKTVSQMKSLQLISPKLNNYIMEVLQEQYNIHSYDLQIDARPIEKGMEIIIRFGEHFSNQESKVFTREQINQISDEVKEFIVKTGERCTEVLIDDYFKIYAP